MLRKHALRTAGLTASMLLVLYVLAVLTPPGQALDDLLFGWAQRLGVGPLRHWWPLVARDWAPFALVVLVVVMAVAALRRRPFDVVGAAVLVGTSTAASLGLKSVLVRPEYSVAGYPENTFPSTHVSATAALLVAVWLLAPRRPVWLTRTLGAAIALVAIGNVVGHAHRPSDVVGSVLLVTAVTAAVRAIGGGPPDTLTAPGQSSAGEGDAS